jgi:hypothetical protein
LPRRCAPPDNSNEKVPAALRAAGIIGMECTLHTDGTLYVIYYW